MSTNFLMACVCVGVLALLAWFVWSLRPRTELPDLPDDGELAPGRIIYAAKGETARVFQCACQIKQPLRLKSPWRDDACAVIDQVYDHGIPKPGDVCSCGRVRCRQVRIEPVGDGTSWDVSFTYDIERLRQSRNVRCARCGAHLRHEADDRWHPCESCDSQGTIDALRKSRDRLIEERNEMSRRLAHVGSLVLDLKSVLKGEPVKGPPC